jgi:hypothetical protein
MRKHDKIDFLIIADKGMLLTQAGEVLPKDRIFSSRVYDNNLNNWTEWSQEQVEEFIAQMEQVENEREEVKEVENEE